MVRHLLVAVFLAAALALCTESKTSDAEKRQLTDLLGNLGNLSPDLLGNLGNLRAGLLGGEQGNPLAGVLGGAGNLLSGGAAGRPQGGSGGQGGLLGGLLGPDLLGGLLGPNGLLGGLVGGLLEAVDQLLQELIKTLEGIDPGDKDAVKGKLDKEAINDVCPTCPLIPDAATKKSCLEYCLENRWSYNVTVM